MNKLIIVLMSLALSACNFHLKGKQPFDHLPEKNWFVVGGEILQQPLETALRYASANIVPEENAQAQLRIISFESKHDIYTITRAAKLNEYLLSLRVTAQAYRNGKPWGEPLTANVRRNMPYSDAQVLGKVNEEEILWQEMYQDAANQIVRQLGFLQPNNHVNHLQQENSNAQIGY